MDAKGFVYVARSEMSGNGSGAIHSLEMTQDHSDLDLGHFMGEGVRPPPNDLQGCKYLILEIEPLSSGLTTTPRTLV